MSRIANVKVGDSDVWFSVGVDVTGYQSATVYARLAGSDTAEEVTPVFTDETTGTGLIPISTLVVGQYDIETKIIDGAGKKITFPDYMFETLIIGPTLEV